MILQRTFLLALLSLPALASAAGLVPCDGPDCQTCHIVTLVQRIIEFLIEFLTAASIIIFALGGLKMVMSAGDMGAIKTAKTMMSNAVVGLVILLTAWLIVDTTLKLLMREGTLLRPWHEIQCVPQPSGAVAGTPTTPGAVTPTPTPTGGQLTDAEARALLSAAGISVNKIAAEGTSLAGINEATIQDAVDLKAACGCEIVITGGTEGGHSGGTMSHGTGYKYDIRLNSTLDSYITSNYTNTGTRSDGAPTYTASDGTVYAREGDHWDVLVKSS